jgi:dTDP-4-amino-4,6-dideoxygalactose transaminase
MEFMRNFGHDGRVDYSGVGINAKNSELHAAFGLANFEHIDAILSKRKEQYAQYSKKLKNHSAVKLTVNQNADYNCAYFPLLFENEYWLLKTTEQLLQHCIVPRRYFYPALTSLPYVKKYHTPIADDMASRVLCLPLYHTLLEEEIDIACQILLSAQQHYAPSL